MSTDAIDVDFRPSGALAVREEAPAPPALFGTTDPVEIVTQAVRVADALKAVVVSKRLIANIQGKEYPQVEAWLTLAAMLRLTTICEWSRRVESGWEARVYVRDANGATVGAAEAQCLSTEKSKRQWEDYALRSMAQTRATSKSLRSVLGFVMVLAGYEPTPMEEMPGADLNPPAAAKPPAAEKPKVSAEVRAAMEARIATARELGLLGAGTFDQGIVGLKNWAKSAGAAWNGPSIDAALARYAEEKHRREAQEAANAAFDDVSDYEPEPTENAPQAPETAQEHVPADGPPTTMGRLAAIAANAAKRGVVPYAPTGSAAHKALMAAFGAVDAQIAGTLSEMGIEAVSKDARRHAFAEMLLNDPKKGSSQTWTRDDYDAVMRALAQIRASSSQSLQRTEEGISI